MTRFEFIVMCILHGFMQSLCAVAFIGTDPMTILYLWPCAVLYNMLMMAHMDELDTELWLKRKPRKREKP